MKNRTVSNKLNSLVETSKVPLSFPVDKENLIERYYVPCEKPLHGFRNPAFMRAFAGCAAAVVICAVLVPVAVSKWHGGGDTSEIYTNLEYNVVSDGEVANKATVFIDVPAEINGFKFSCAYEYINTRDMSNPYWVLEYADETGESTLVIRYFTDKSIYPNVDGAMFDSLKNTKTVGGRTVIYEEMNRDALDEEMNTDALAKYESDEFIVTFHFHNAQGDAALKTIEDVLG